MFEFLWKTECSHEKISANMISGYCPDCGEYVENHWYITRCNCCGFKQTSRIRKGKVIANNNFCQNCGSNAFIVEELDCLDIVNVNYAVIKKQVRETKKTNPITTWVEQNSYTPMKLIPSC